ncbi:hypothetical protein ACL02U_30565 [Streptomyces sp. MS06]|uniref:hypothetical protein n=1 Tax=Streptomyces sp. MS06 TaxID=3385974 RepID=UPI0039A08E1F
MGIESDKVVYEYLSRVGDVAQQRQLPSATRMRLVTRLRDEIDRNRAKTPVDSPAAVRRILSRLGSPDDVVTSAADGTAPSGGPAAAPGTPPSAAVPAQRADEPRRPRPGRPRRRFPRPRTGSPEPTGAGTGGPSAPGTASTSKPGGGAVPAAGTGPAGPGPDWWSMGGGGPLESMDEVPGFVGGVEIPDLLKPPPEEDTAQAEKRPAPAVPAPQGEAGEAGEAVGEEAAAPAPDRSLRRRLPSLGRSLRAWSNPLLLLAAGCLLFGAVLGNWFALILGWLIAYASRRLSDAETKWAVVGLPALALAAGVTWLWGRADGRWGQPVSDGHWGDAVAGTWPWVVRGAAVASALFVVWRSQRQRGG